VTLRVTEDHYERHQFIDRIQVPTRLTLLL